MISNLELTFLWIGGTLAAAIYAGIVGMIAHLIYRNFFCKDMEPDDADFDDSDNP
jgi:hypothetical protein